MDLFLLCREPIITLSTLTTFMTNNNFSSYPLNTAMPGYWTQLEAPYQLGWSNQQFPYALSQEWILYRNISGKSMQQLCTMSNKWCLRKTGHFSKDMLVLKEQRTICLTKNFNFTIFYISTIIINERY